MGKYINFINGKHIGTSAYQKAQSIQNAGGVELKEPPTEFQEGLVCVVDNIMFGAAGYAYDEREMEYFKQSNGRPTRWFLWEDAKNHVDKE